MTAGSLRFATRFSLALSALALFSASANAEFLIGLTTENRVVTFDSATPGTYLSNVVVTGLQSGENLIGIDIRPQTGVLYGLGSTSRLYTVNTTTGAATQVGTAGAFSLTGTNFGFDFNPTVDRIRVTSSSGQNLRLNPDTGAIAATDLALAYNTGDPNFGTAPTIGGSAYTNNFSGATTTTLFDIDTNLDILATQNPPNNGTLNTIGSLGVNLGGTLGFDISGFTTVAYVAGTAGTGSPTFSQLYTINLSTGALTLLGNIGTNSANNATLIGLAAPAVPEPSSLALTGLGLAAIAVVARRRTRRLVA